MTNEQLITLFLKMTLKEKIGQLVQLAGDCFGTEAMAVGPREKLGITQETVDNCGSVLNVLGAEKVRKIQSEYLAKSRLKIPLLFMADVIYGYQTVFPIPLGLGATWNPELIREDYKMIAEEASADGAMVTFSPAVDLVRDARWGRCLEMLGEDPYHTACFAKAMVEGFQNNWESGKSIASCVKHFAGYGAAEAGREYNTVDMSTRRFRQDYLPGYKSAVEAGCEMVMTSFNTVDEIPATANKWLMKDVLREEWGFDGVIITDYAAIKELIPHGVAEDEYEASKLAMNASVDIDMKTSCYAKEDKIMAKYTEFCDQILANVGGKDNVSGAVHCMTRLRLNLKDRSKVDVDKVKEIKGVLGAQFSGEQFQIIIGQHVSEVYPEFCAMAGVGELSAIDENLDKEPFDIKKVPAKVLDYISGSVAPTIPIMMAAGFFKLFYSLLGPDMLNIAANESQLMQTIYIVGNAGLYFMPVYAAWSAAKKLGTSIPIALMLGTLLIDQNIINIVTAAEPFSIYGLIPMQLNNYTSTILPTLLSVWILKYVYKFFDKYVPKAIKVIGVPFFTVIVMVPLVFCALAPVGNWIGMILATIFEGLYNVAGPLAIAVIAAFWPFLVATGMHIAVVQIAIINITTLGFDPIVLAGSNIANYALMGMAVAYFIKNKGEEKQLAGANAITLIVGGISEPTLFAVLLRNKKAMLCQIIGGFIGGLVGGIMGVAVYTLGASNFLTVLQYAGGPAENFTKALIACAIAFVVALAVGLVIGFGDQKDGEGLKSYKGKYAAKLKKN